ncbi:MAG TPA: LacI family DNA-binding transcriptional regulator, partial [Rhodanobacteraceae bacterium]|nr:LacI family DNA-binding transcriptional regulator [Rhodanobacteraceae bacterium]
MGARQDAPAGTAEGGKAVVTIKDVAREARVSVATVSRALNGSVSVT